MRPVSTYRVQLTADFTFDDAAAQVPYLADLGVTHLYCSPWLTAEPGSTHGYDVVDHTHVNPELGGEQGLERLSAACREAGLGIVLDIVPNHMSVSSPHRNQAWWSLLKEGQQSPYAGWFDVDWGKGPLLLPILGAPLAECLDDLELEEDRIRYYEHQLPLADGSLVPGDVAATLADQHYRLAFWRAADELTYRRFFDVTTLAGVRVEDEQVFADTHAVVLEQVRSGVLDGLRVDHPDGLADPGGYLERLASAAPQTWVVVEKILEPGEELPDWPCAGTTGYDAMHQVTGLFVDPSAEAVLDELWAGPAYDEVVTSSKRLVLSRVLVPEGERLLDLATAALREHDVTRHALREALVELLVAFEVYRAYVPHPVALEQIAHAAAQAAVGARHRAREIRLLAQLANGELGSPEFVTRFQQTCGPVMAKGVEDTTFYRYTRLVALNEVGGDPSQLGTSVEAFHDYCLGRQQRWPHTMTGLSTHDTKRSEDVRARLVLLSHDPKRWAGTVRRWSAAMPVRIDHPTELLIWQTLVGAWPLPEDRLLAYLQKAVREAKSGTSWLDQDEAYERSVAEFATTALALMGGEIEQLVTELAPAWRSTVLAQKLVQLTMPGVADCYQGTELVDLSLVDPDNRRPVDYDRRAALLSSPAEGLDADKQRVVSSCLRLRRDHPDWFLDGDYTPLAVAEGTVAFSRAGQVVTAAPLRGGAAARPELPGGTWVDLLEGLPVSLLVRA